jgi:hypothetical protein
MNSTLQSTHQILIISISQLAKHSDKQIAKCGANVVGLFVTFKKFGTAVYIPWILRKAQYIWNKSVLCYLPFQMILVSRIFP